MFLDKKLSVSFINRRWREGYWYLCWDMFLEFHFYARLVSSPVQPRWRQKRQSDLLRCSEHCSLGPKASYSSHIPFFRNRALFSKHCKTRFCAYLCVWLSLEWSILELFAQTLFAHFTLSYLQLMKSPREKLWCGENPVSGETWKSCAVLILFLKWGFLMYFLRKLNINARKMLNSVVKLSVLCMFLS